MAHLLDIEKPCGAAVEPPIEECVQRARQVEPSVHANAVQHRQQRRQGFQPHSSARGAPQRKCPRGSGLRGRPPRDGGTAGSRQIARWLLLHISSIYYHAENRWWITFHLRPKAVKCLHKDTTFQDAAHSSMSLGE